MNITTRPATSRDVVNLHPELAGSSYRAWVAELDGEPAGVVGLALTRPHACIFCGFNEKLRPYLKAPSVLRLLMKTQAAIRERGKPVYALRDMNEARAPDILARLGFKFAADLDGEQVYMWSPD